MSFGNVSAAQAAAAGASGVYSEGVNVSKMQEETSVLPKKNNMEQLTEVVEAGMNIDKTLKSFIMDALKAAGLQINERMTELVKALLDRQQPVDKNTLMVYNRLLVQNPGVSPETIIAMHKNGLNITKASVEQFEACKNNDNDIFRNIDDAAHSIGGLVKELVSADSGKAVGLLDSLARFVDNMTASSATDAVDAAAAAVDAAYIVKEWQQMTDDTTAYDVKVQKDIPDIPDYKDNTINELLNEYESEISGSISVNMNEGNLFKKLALVLKELPEDRALELADRLDTEKFARLAQKELKEVLFLKPEEVTDKKVLAGYYRKLEASVDGFLNSAKELGTSVNNSLLVKTFDNISDNVLFMNQVNEYMPYVQLPLKLLKKEAHGEFYVMKRSSRQQTGQDETLTAFLRLSMEQLGELDVMVKLKDTALDVDFKAEKTSVIGFIEENLSILEDRLREKGYVAAMRVGGKEKEFDFEKDFLEADSNDGTIGRYSFDMKI